MENKNLILLHGALGTKEQVAALKAALSDTFTVYDLNFEGHGGRGSTREFSMSHFAENVLQFMKEHSIDKAHFFGFSMGGYVALQFAKDHSHKVQSIVTLGTKFDWTPESSAKEVKMLNPEVILEKVPKFAQHLESVHAPNDWKQLLEKTADMMLSLGSGQALTAGEFEQISPKVLICVGGKDHMVSQQESEAVASHLPNSSFRLLPDFVHPVEKADPELLAGIISEFTLQ